MRSFFDWLQNIDASVVRSVLIRISLVSMVVGSIAGNFSPTVKQYFESLHLPILWLTAYLVLAELISVRERVDEISKKKDVFLPLEYINIYKWTKYKKIDLYLSSDGLSILKSLNKITSIAQINLRIFISLDSKHEREFPYLKRLKNAKVFVTNYTEPSSFAIFGDSNNSSSVYLLGLGTDNEPMFFELDKDDEYANSLKNKLTTIEHESIKVERCTEPIIDYVVSEIERLCVDVIDNKKVKLINSTFFRVASLLVSNSQKSIFAVDFISPLNWVQKPIIKAYAKSHNKAQGKKQRVHIYSIDKIGSKEWETNDYKAYLKIMNDVGVEVKFMELELLDRARYEERGSTIIDEEVVAIAINPVDGAPFGELNYSKSIVSTYTARFTELWELAEPKDIFMDKLKEKEDS